jgi:outer membrane receptor for monomeric catechols
LSLLGGARLDIMSTDYHIDWADPFGGANRLADSTVVGLPSANGSVIYKWLPDLSTYGTYNYSQNPAGAIGNGGGVTTGGNRSFSSASLKTDAILYELGAKKTLFDNRLFLNAAVFQQERVQLQQDRSSVNFRTKGIELEANYQPNRNFYVTVGYSYTESRVNRPEFAVNNTDLPYYSNPGQYAGGGPYKRQGVPDHLMNLLATYKFDFGLGFSANLVTTSEVNNNAAGTLVIPWQYSVDLGVFYQQKRWEARLSLLNVTDEKNWSAPNAVYGNESILAELPFRAEGRLTIKF